MINCSPLDDVYVISLFGVIEIFEVILSLDVMIVSLLPSVVIDVKKLEEAPSDVVTMVLEVVTPSDVICGSDVVNLYEVEVVG
ncbi:MAG: hypothetical protein ACO26G_04055 [Rickettsiales bacterium]